MRIFVLLLGVLISLSSYANIYNYQLGEKSTIDALYPEPKVSAYPHSTSEVIELFLKQSLDRDHISYQSATVEIRKINNKDYYFVKIASDDPLASEYPKKQPQWLNTAALALVGINACKAAGRDCWDPLHGFGNPPSNWNLYLPLGLPMVKHKIIMLLNCPTQSSLLDYNYLNSDTSKRWERLLLTVGVKANELSLYEAIIDIIPITVPGNQYGYGPSIMATYFFDSAQYHRDYLSSMLKTLTASCLNSSAKNTCPVIVFGIPARLYWRIKHANEIPIDPKTQMPTDKILSVGKVKLDPLNSKQTPFIFDFHPSAAFYKSCINQNENIITKETTDLVTACFAYQLGNNPNLDPEVVRNHCRDTWMDHPGPEQQSKICINARLDMTPINQPKIWNAAEQWCHAHAENPCPS